MRSAGKFVCTAADDDAFEINHHRADHGVGTRPAPATLGNRQRTRHVIGVGEH
jgi:hypothetical protein